MIIKPVRRKHFNTYLTAATLPFLAHSFLIPAFPLSIAVSVFLILNIEFKRLKSKCVLTNKELFIEEGILNKSRIRVELSDLVKLSVKQNLIQRILNYGHIEFEVRSSKPVKLEDIHNPSQFVDRIRELLKE